MQFLILGWTIPFKVQAYLHFVVAILNSATVPYQTHLRVWWIAEQPMDTTPTLFKPNVLREHKSKMFAQLQPVETSKLVLSAASAKTTLSVSHWVYTVRWDLLRHLPPCVCVWIRGVNYFQSLGPQRFFFFFLERSGQTCWNTTAWENVDRSEIIWCNMCFHSEQAERWYWSENNIFNYSTALSGKWAGLRLGCSAAFHHTHSQTNASHCTHEYTRTSSADKTEPHF